MSKVQIFAWHNSQDREEHWGDSIYNTIEEFWENRKKFSGLKRLNRLHLSSFEWEYLQDIDTMGHTELLRVTKEDYMDYHSRNEARKKLEYDKLQGEKNDDKSRKLKSS